jgi:hypothetical protein
MRTYESSPARTALLVIGLLALSACDDPVVVGGGGGSGGSETGAGGGITGSGGSDTGSGAGGAGTGTGTGGSAGGGSCPDALDDALTQFIGCMSLNDWVSTGMPDIASTPTSNGTLCYGCHTSDVGGVRLGNPNTPGAIEDTFNWYTQLFAVHYIATGTVEGATCSVNLAVSQEFKDKENDGTPHPTYDFTAPQASLDAFFQVTYDKMVNGSCPP